MARQWSRSEDALNRLFRRCLECPQNVQPQCPASCPDGWGCALQTQTCNSCAAMICQKIHEVPGLDTPQKSTPTGAIIGGVVGGVFTIIVVTYLVWRFCIKRTTRKQELWEPPEKNTIGRSGTTLTRSHSIASTVMTRASNVIQIAYIPGVTVRSAPQSPELPPPMPSIPSTYNGTSVHSSSEVEQHFFMPKDLRDSVWSDTSSVMTDPRISIAASLANRDTIYQENAEVPPIPAQYAYRAQANAVSVRSGSSTPSIAQAGGNTPAVPQIPKVITGSSIVARNVVAKPIELKKTASGSSVPTLSTFPKKSLSRRATPAPTISDEKEVVVSRGVSPASTAFSETPLLSRQQPSFMSMESASGTDTSTAIPAEGALSDTAPTGRPTTAYTKQMIHEAMFRAVQDTSRPLPTTSPRPELPKHDSGPFSDANEIK